MPTVDQVLASRSGRGRLRLRTGLAVAAALHLGAGAAAVLGPELGAEERQPIEYVKVRVVPAAALGSTRPAPPKPKPKPPEPKPPEPEPEPPKPEPEPEPPKPTPTAAPAERKPESRPPPPASEPAPARPAEPDRAQREGSPRGSALGTSTAAVAGVDNPNFTYDYYLDRMLAMIEAQWLRPRVEQPIEAMVHFRIQRDGRITELELVTGSGINAFDLAALRAVQTAAPFPPLPASYRSDSLGVNLIVR